MSFDLPALPDGWVFSPLEGCAAPGSISYGVVQPGAPSVHGIPMIRVNNFRDMRLDLSDVMRVAPEVEAKYARTRLSGGEVLLTLVGSVGQVAEVPPSCAGFNVARAVGVIKPANGIDSRWIAICLRSPLSQHLLGTRANTTVQTTINLKDVRALPIPIPPLAERSQIADFISALDERIALLRKTNATLEAIAQALFKSWFVDFDPVRAKQEGLAPTGMDEATAALFSDGFENSPLGSIPKGWRAAKIGEVCSLGRGSSPRPIQEYMGNDIPWIKIADATASDGMFVLTTKEKIKREGVAKSVAVRNGDLIMSNSASCGIPVFVELEGCIHDGWLYFQGFSAVSKNLMFYWLRHISAHLVRIADGSVQKNLNIGLVSAQSIICPPPSVPRAFDAVVQPLLDRIRDNCQQAQTLAALRDTLLPRLISGQLRLPEAETLSALA
ncbi:restriction endonuclease subunit S [Piscinibacter sp.]|jgi:type I restriction enzyme S subunit|uniref:restriction endonuclease subunit S n=1 Tax=Piscinibacter sp. TaxID=1903157 RepID=UPI003559B17D